MLIFIKCYPEDGPLGPKHFATLKNTRVIVSTVLFINYAHENTDRMYNFTTFRSPPTPAVLYLRQAVHCEGTPLG